MCEKMFTTIATKSGYNDTHAHVQCVTYSGRRMDVRPLRRTHVHYVGRTSITPGLKGHTSSLRLTLVLLTSRRSGRPIGPLRQNLASKKKMGAAAFSGDYFTSTRKWYKTLRTIEFWRAYYARSNYVLYDGRGIWPKLGGRKGRKPFGRQWDCSIKY